MERTGTCKERISKEYAARKYDLLRITGNVKPSREWLKDQDMPEDVSERIDSFFETLLELGPAGEYTRGIKVNYPLVPVRVLLSTGGPEDGFILGVRRVRGVRGYYYAVAEVHYWYSDWFDGAHLKVRAGSKFETVLKDLFGPYVENMEFTEEEE